MATPAASAPRTSGDPTAPRLVAGLVKRPRLVGLLPEVQQAFWEGYQEGLDGETTD